MTNVCALRFENLKIVFIANLTPQLGMFSAQRFLLKEKLCLQVLRDFAKILLLRIYVF